MLHIHLEIITTAIFLFAILYSLWLSFQKPATVGKSPSPYCSNCDNCDKSNLCSYPGTPDSECMGGIATLKKNGWPLPSKSQTGAARDGNYYPCCYLGDMWCKGTDQQNGAFDETIDYMNKRFGFKVDKNSSSNLCKQVGCPHW